jgi:hypothetical protein
VAVKPEQDIAQLETLLRQLEKEYELFFSGQLRREPAGTENAVLVLIRAYASRPLQNNALAFKYNALVARFNSFKTVWTRRLREREEGRAPAGTLPPRPAQQRPEPRAPAAGGALMQEYVTSNPLQEPRHLKQFFETYVKLRVACGEPVEKLRTESFQKALAEKIEKIKRDQGCEQVLLRVVTEQGRTRLVAKPFRREGTRKDPAP